MKTPKIKTYVLMVSTKFPAYHKRKGEETFFPYKILTAIGKELGFYDSKYDFSEKEHTIRNNYLLWEKRIKEILEGKAILSIRYHSLGRYVKGSKQIEICKLDKDSGIGIQKIDFVNDKDGVYSLKYAIINYKYVELLDVCKSDGLSYEDFKEWFKPYDLSEPMAVIWFVNKRY